jgi:hypothetical protein
MKSTSSITNMTCKKLFILPLILAALAAPLCAQTNDSNNNGTNAAVAAAPPTTPTQPPPQMASAPAAIPEQHDSYHPDPDDMIPIFGIVGVFGGGTVVVGLFLYFRYRRNKMLHETLRAMIDKGVNIPPELLSMPPESFAPRPRSDLRTGLILICVGVSLFLVLDPHAARFGLIPVLIGVAFLISWIVEKKKKDQPGK